MLYLIGLGLGDAKDISVKGLEIVKKVGKVYLEAYTSILCCGQAELEHFYGRSVIVADRELLEQGADEILNAAVNEPDGAAVLIVGDPLNATTHTDLIIRAVNRAIPYQIVHNASILSAVACCGLQVYNFGETVSIPFWTDRWKPESFYDKILRNIERGLHTLCLLDIKVKEPDYDAMIKGITRYEPARFMTVGQAASQLIEIIRNKHSADPKNPPHIDAKSLEKPTDFDSDSELPLHENSTCICLARVGSTTQKIIKSSLIEVIKLDLGAPLHSLVIPGDLHPLEIEMLNIFVKQNIETEEIR